MLLRDINTISKFIPVNKSLDFEKLKPFVTDVERSLSEFIKNPLFKKFDDYLNANSDDNAYYNEAILLLQDSITHLSFFEGFDLLNTVFSNQGMHRIELDNNGKKPLFHRQEENLKSSFKRLGYKKLDTALQYMDTNSAEFDNFNTEKKFFINNTVRFDEIFFINRSVIIFLRLKRQMQVAEDFDIKPRIGLTFYNLLKSEISTNTLTDANKIIVDFLQKADAYFTVARSVDIISYEFSELGITSTQITSNTNNVKEKNQLSAEEKEELREALKETGNGYLNSCLDFIEDNINDYPLFDTEKLKKGSLYDLKSTEKIGVI